MTTKDDFFVSDEMDGGIEVAGNKAYVCRGNHNTGGFKRVGSGRTIPMELPQAIRLVNQCLYNTECARKMSCLDALVGRTVSWSEVPW